MNPMAAADPEYRRSKMGVNGRLAGRACRSRRSALALPLLLMAGCSAVTDRGGQRQGVVLAVRYDVEPVVVAEGRARAVETIQRELEQAADLGFSDVVVRHADAPYTEAVAKLAADAGLAVAVPIRPLDYFVLTGRLPAGCPDEETLVRRALHDSGRTMNQLGIVVDGRVARTNAQRAEQLAVMAGRHHRRCFVLRAPSTADRDEDDTASVAGPRVATIDVEARGSMGAEAPLAAWLAQYHGGLARGLTDGIVVDRFGRLWGDPYKAESADDAGRSARKAALAALLTRARTWGARLGGLEAHNAEKPVAQPEAVQTRVFAHGRRRFVLIFNQEAGGGYARGDVTLPATIRALPVKRAVEVPPSPGHRAGHVFHARRGQVTLPVALRPGDAVLFEVF